MPILVQFFRKLGCCVIICKFTRSCNSPLSVDCCKRKLAVSACRLAHCVDERGESCTQMTRRGERSSKRRPRGDGTRGPRSSGGSRFTPCFISFTRYRADDLDSQFVSDQCKGIGIGFRIDLISVMAFWILLWVKLGCMAAMRNSSENSSQYEDSLGQARSIARTVHG